MSARRSLARAVLPRTSLLAVLLCLCTSALAEITPRWARYPAISPDGSTIVFTYRGDLWRVATAGGVAVPLTTHGAHDHMPVWSADGEHLAFASDRHGNFDVYVMAASGGTARRLTTDSAAERPWAFTADGSEVLFGAAIQDAASNRGYPTGAQAELYAVPVAGGRVRQVLTTPAVRARMHPDGVRLLYEDDKGYEGEWRKHQVSSMARDLWSYDPRSGEHRQLTDFVGEDRDPVPAADASALYYLSEESGTFNVHRAPLDGGPSTQLTSFEGIPVRSLSRSVDGTLAFSWDGEVYTLRDGAAPQRVPIVIRTDLGRSGPEVVSVDGASGAPVLSPDGDEIAFTFRGDVFVTALEHGMTRQITRTPGRERDVTFAPDGHSLVYAAERDGRWGIYETTRVREEERYFFAATLLEESALVLGDVPASQPAFSPDGSRLAFVVDRDQLNVLDVASGEDFVLLDDAQLAPARIGGQHFSWSPDGQWILFDQSVPGSYPGEIGLVRADGSEPAVNLTQSGFYDYYGQWALGGEAIVWLSNRDGLRSAAMTGGSQDDVYALFLTQDAWDRFRLGEDEYALLSALEEEAAEEDEDADDEEGEDGGDGEPAELEPVAIDLDRAELRRARLTITSASIGDALLSEDGETLYTIVDFGQGYDLWSTALRSGETSRLAEFGAEGAGLLPGSDGESLLVHVFGGGPAGNLVTVGTDDGEVEDVPIEGEMALDRDAERAQMFAHVWSRTNETFYTEGFHGADWDALRTTYARYLPHIGNEYEFAEMLGELMGELNVSHASVRYSPNDASGDDTASLGIFRDLDYAGPGIRIDEVIANGPLDTGELDIGPGDVIEAIGGREIAAGEDPAPLLNRRAGQRTLLRIRQGNESDSLVVVPVDRDAESELLYARWVRRNREEVDRLSDGRLGYVHVPGMDDASYRNFYADVLGRFADREGLVVDTRFNGGGDLVADLAMFLSGERFLEYGTDARVNGYEPNFRWTKPSIAIVGESNYSDGHCFAYAYQDLGIGSLVGMPVPGTCTFGGWERLPNGVVWGVPGVGVRNVDGVYLENFQTEPDLRVESRFEARGAGTDEQLEAAVAELLDQLP